VRRKQSFVDYRKRERERGRTVDRVRVLFRYRADLDSSSTAPATFDEKAEEESRNGKDNFRKKKRKFGREV